MISLFMLTAQLHMGEMAHATLYHNLPRLPHPDLILAFSLTDQDFAFIMNI
jgi:hypothetical protein